MSQLYIRVKTGFYSHRKTAKLRLLIGDDAFWIPPRLWAFAAENQPDGNLSGYSSEELAMLLGCLKHATSILQALKAVEFVDADGFIHGWREHNGYHERYSERAKLAAKARWTKEKPPTPPKEDIGNRKGERGDKHCLSNATRMLVAFKPPGIEEIKLQCAKIGLPETEAFKFLNHYEANGWKVGRNPMRSWTHALSNWKLNSRNYENSRPNNSQPPSRNDGTYNTGTTDYSKLVR